MSTMRSGRGARLPGMGAPAAADAPPVAPETAQPTVDEHTTPEVEHAPAHRPKPHRSSVATKHRNTPPTHADEERKRTDHVIAPDALPVHAPHAGEPKVQVNPRIYRGIWRHYEQLVDELPRERRRGALTALVNAVLAQHAPRDVDAARSAIRWLRQAEARDAPAAAREER
jgi:hypothetical protein